MSSKQYVINPKTGRKIKVGGLTFMKMLNKDLIYKKRERCIISVKSKQSEWCKKHKFPFTRDPRGNKCANPWAICNKFFTPLHI